MNVLVSATRQPFAVDEIRKLGRAGHRVTALDSFATAPGSHSRYCHRRRRVAPPRFGPQRFLVEVKRAIREDAIDLVLPTFEEVFYLARHLEELTRRCDLFTSPFATLALLHHKGSFNDLARSLGLAVPATTVVTDPAALRRAGCAHGRFLARPVFSRGGTRILSNVEPWAGVTSFEDCRPTEAAPWLVQDWIDGEDLCTFSIARRGRIVAHVAYVLPIDLEHGSGIVIESVDAPEALAQVERLARHVDYHGQVSFDFRRTPAGDLVVVECNPRACLGVTFLPERVFSTAVCGEPVGAPWVAPAGEVRILSLAVIRDMLLHPNHVVRGLRYLLSPSARDVFHDRHDLLPALFQFLTYSQIQRYRRWAGPGRDRRTDIIEAFSYDFAWQGEPIP